MSKVFEGTATSMDLNFHIRNKPSGHHYARPQRDLHSLSLFCVETPNCSLILRLSWNSGSEGPYQKFQSRSESLCPCFCQVCYRPNCDTCCGGFLDLIFISSRAPMLRNWLATRARKSITGLCDFRPKNNKTRTLVPCWVCYCNDLVLRSCFLLAPSACLLLAMSVDSTVTIVRMVYNG
jgi:hypothetical protein